MTRLSNGSSIDLEGANISKFLQHKALLSVVISAPKLKSCEIHVVI